MVVIKTFSESEAKKLRKSNPDAVVVVTTKQFNQSVQKEQSIRKSSSNIINASELLYTPAPAELLNQISNREQTIKANIQSQNTLLQNPVIANLAQFNAELYQSIGLGFLVPETLKTFAANKRTAEESESQAAKLRLEQQRVEQQKRMQDLEIQRTQQQAQYDALKDLYSTSFFEKLGFGVSSEEQQLQALIEKLQGQNALVDTQTQGIIDYSAYLSALQEAQRDNPQAAQQIEILSTAASKTSFLEQAKPYLIVGGIVVGLIILPSLFKK